MAEENLEKISLEDLTSDQEMVINVFIYEGRLREREDILHLIQSEEMLMVTKGATFGLNKDYDAGYLMALKDIKILIKGLTE